MTYEPRELPDLPYLRDLLERSEGASPALALDMLAEVERLRAENAALLETLQGTQNMLGIILQTFPDVREVCEQLITEMGEASESKAE